MIVKVTEESCTGCGRCQASCPIDAITIYNGKAVISDSCMACGSCIAHCPVGALKL